jgi:hypothetical protein
VADDHVPEAFDWVSAQAECNAAAMFERLRTGAHDDVQRRNALPGRTDGWRFEFESEDDAFEVSRVTGSPVHPKVLAVVTFELAGRRIQIHSEDVDVDITVVVSLDVGGVCRFVVGEAIYTDWEIRRMALEILFFEEELDETE